MLRLSERQIIDLPMWLPIESFEGLYEVNPREGLVRNAVTLKVLKGSLGKHGYQTVHLRNRAVSKHKLIHRIVANAAFDHYNIPTEGLLVMHLDESRTNNSIYNLALGSQCENLAFPEYKKRMSKKMKGREIKPETRKKLSDSFTKKPIGAFKDGELVMRFESTKDAQRKGLSTCAIIGCCKGKPHYNTYHGLEWRYL